MKVPSHQQDNPVSPDMRVLVDGVAFQYENANDIDLWTGVVAQLAKRANVVVLDRGKTPELGDISRVPFPRYNDKYAAADSLLIQKYCDFAAIDVFISTSYTTPAKTPTVMLLPDSEVWPDAAWKLGADRQSSERALCILFARRRVFTSVTSMGRMSESLGNRINDRTISAVNYAPLNWNGHDSLAREQFEKIADHLVTQIDEVYGESQLGRYTRFMDRWAALRAIQAQVEF